MKIFCLRTVYETTNLGFSDGETLVAGITAARLVRECKIPIISHTITGVEPDGKKRIVITAEDRTFRGQPLLLEILATDETPDRMTAVEIRPELESQTAELAAVLTWSLPGTVGVRLADALFSRDPDSPPNEWTWDDVKPLTVAGFFADISVVKSRHADAERTLQSQSETRRSATITAMRWWRHGLRVGSPVDRFIAHWIVLETFSAHVSSEDSIGSRVQAALGIVFPGLAHQRVKQMKDVLYRARCKVVHAGWRDIAHLNSLVEVVAATASACITFLVDGSVSDAPREDLLQTLGI